MAKASKKTTNTNKQDVGSTTSSCSNTQDESPKKESPKHKKFRATIFFDGTGNARSNTQARLDSKMSKETIGPPTQRVSEEMQAYEKYAGSGSSYENDFTNVSKLEKYLMLPEDPDKKFNDFDAHFKIYISGIGTDDLTEDSSLGQATGRGNTGVKGKVEKAIENIVSFITGSAEEGDIIDKIQLDSVGFSRGAAAARYFVYAALQDKDLMLKKKLNNKKFKNVGEVKSGFVGLFDTVASVKTGNPFSDNTQWLHLDAISVSEKVVHLAAADEYRKNFPLTNIKSKGSTEIFLPGVHSDVGGGYTDNASEDELEIFDIDTLWTGKKTLDRLEQERKWLVDIEGWYHENEVSKPTKWNEIYVKRKNIRNTYSRIPLHIMKNHIKNTTLKFDNTEMDAQDGLPIPGDEHEDLNKLYAMIGTDGSGNWKTDIALLKRIRHKYFHFSAHYKKKGYSTTNRVIGVNDPRLVNGKREREILNG